MKFWGWGSVGLLPGHKITNENLEILSRFRFRNGKANRFPQVLIFFCICFRNDHVGHTQATTTGHTYRHIRNYYLSNSKTFQDGTGNGNFGKINSKDFQDGNCGGHLKPVTLKPVIRIFRIFRVFVSAFSAFSAFPACLLCGISSDPCFAGVRGTFRIFRILPVSVSNR